MQPRLRRGFSFCPASCCRQWSRSGVGASPGWGIPSRRSKERLALIPTTTVRRADMTASLTAGGRVESSQNTEIECELERMSIGGQGNEFTGGGSSTILSLLAEGTTVKKGDVLCTLDASSYEELLRQQRIILERRRPTTARRSSSWMWPGSRSASSRMGCSSRRSRTIKVGSPWPSPTSNEVPTDWNGRSGCLPRATLPPARSRTKNTAWRVRS